MKEFFLKYWKWIILIVLIAAGCYISAWYYLNVVRSKGKEGDQENE